ncbi:MAG: glycosyltransferase family 4 protein [Solirubrobacterales bacterium]
MRIAQLAPVAMPVVPGEGDSIEQLVSLLTEELVRRGHEVTLFATADSVTGAALESCYAQGYREDEELWDWRLPETINAAFAFERAERFQVIHSHTYHFALPFTRFVSTPTAHTYHVQLGPEVVRAFQRYPEARLVAISDYQRQALEGIERVPVIHNGVDTGAFPFAAKGGDYVAFLGRMIPSKGAVEAVRVARDLDLPLVLAGPTSEWFEAEVRPALDGTTVRYEGTLDAAARNELLAGAAALLYPIAYPEPFGLVMVEAMACGTPVAAFGVGAVPEIVQQGVGGHWVRPGEPLAGAVEDAMLLDRRGVRQSALERFDYRRMADGYERLYGQLAAADEAPPR